MIKVQRPPARLARTDERELARTLGRHGARPLPRKDLIPGSIGAGIEYYRQDLIGPREASLADDGGCPPARGPAASRGEPSTPGEASAAGYLSPAPTRGGQREAR